MPTTIKELEVQVNASKKLIRQFLVDQCGAKMEQGKQFIVTDEQAALVAHHFGARENPAPQIIGGVAEERRVATLEMISSLKEDKARLEERVKGLDAQILLYQEQIQDLREQLRASNDALQTSQESLKSAAKALEESNKPQGFFSRLFGRKQLRERNEE